MALEVAILGSVESRVNGVMVDVPAGKQRALLTLLALRAPHPVLAESAAEALWPEARAGEGIRNLQVTVSRLRRSLRDGGAALETVGSGYRLALATDAIDAQRFESLLRQAQQKRSEEAPSDARRLLDEAVGLWRGSPLADVAFESFAQAEIARLEELRLVALEDRIDLRLADGDHAYVVVELERLVGEHPFRERLVGLLMLALYLSGRQSEALDVYRNCRQRLVDDLGLEPGLALRDLERAILDHRVALVAHGHPAAAERARDRGLPTPPNRTIGRAHEIDEVAELVRTGPSRVLTLIGPGGVGKTRLALEVAHAVEPEFADGAHFVALDSLRRPEEVVAAFITALRVVLLPGEPPADGLHRFLATKEMLLVVDNCEHLLAAAPFIGALPGFGNAVTLLATSREPLAVGAERCFPVSPLSLPSEAQRGEELTEVHAVALFCERARARDARFELSEHNAPSVREICVRVDGLPLAIELAAARSGLLSSEEIARRLRIALGVLGSSARDAPARHHTLRATIDWSYDLLSEVEQECFVRFAIFRGGATIEAAEAITGADLDTLDLLVAKSLLVRGERSGATRLTMLETVREYAKERLDRTKDLQEIAERHARFFLGLARREGSAPCVMGADQREHRSRLDVETDNFAAALTRAIESANAELALALCAALGDHWLLGRPHPQDAVDWANRSLRMADATGYPHLRVRVLCVKAWAIWQLGRRGQMAEVEVEAESIARELGHPALLSQVLQLKAGACEGLTAKRHADEAVALAIAAGSEWEIATAVATRATCATSVAELRQRVGPAATLLQTAGNLYELASLLASAAGVAVELGGYEDAKEFLDRAIPVARGLDTPWLWVVIHVNYGMTALLTGDLETADDAFREELRLCRKLTVRPFARMGILGLASISALRGDDHRSARLMGAAMAHGYGEPQTPDEARAEAAFIEPARARTDTESWDSAVRNGSALSFEEAIGYALESR